MPVTVSDPVLEFALALAIAVGAIVALLFVEILWLRFLLRRRERTRRRAVERWRPVLAEAVASGAIPADLPKVGADEWPYFAHLWNELHESLRGPPQASLESLAAAVRFERVALKWVKRRKLGSRLLAILSLGNMRAVAARDALASLLDNRNPYLSMAAAQALVRIDARAELPRVLAVAAQRVDWPKSRMLAVLREAGPELATGPVVALLNDPDPDIVRRAVAWLGAIEQSAMNREIGRLLLADDPEVVAAACRNAADPSNLPALRRLLTSDTWFVRLQAAVAVARFAVAEDVEVLTPLLDDPNWWVRYRLAQAICALPGIGHEELERIRADAIDGEAQEMLRHLMAVRTIT